MSATATIHHGDCLDHMRTMPDGSIDAVIMDPPYCSGGNTEATRKGALGQGLRSETLREGKERWFAGDAMTTPGLVWLLRSIAFEAERVLVPGGSILTFCDWRMWANLAPALESGGLRLQNMIVWDKQHAGLGVGFRAQHELIAHLTTGPLRSYEARWGNVIRASRVTAAERQHPTQKPVDLLQKLVLVVTPPGGTVLDPFCGSGSTGVAAVREGRSFVGVERDAEFVEVARKRIEQEQAQLSLFAG